MFQTFCENQSGGRPDSEKGLMARLTETLDKKRHGKTIFVISNNTC